MALGEAEFGYPDMARRQALAAVGTVPGKYVRSWAALALAQADDGADARQLADRLNSEFPTDRLIQNYWLPTIRAQIELSEGNAMQALEFLRAAEPFNFS